MDICTITSNIRLPDGKVIPVQFCGVTKETAEWNRAQFLSSHPEYKLED